MHGRHVWFLIAPAEDENVPAKHAKQFSPVSAPKIVE